MTNEIEILLTQLRDDVRTGFAEMRVRLSGIEKELAVLNHQVANLTKQMGRLTAEHEVFDERLTKLENPSGIQ